MDADFEELKGSIDPKINLELMAMDDETVSEIPLETPREEEKLRISAPEEKKETTFVPLKKQPSLTPTDKLSVPKAEEEKEVKVKKTLKSSVKKEEN